MALTAGTIIETVASWLDGPELAECVIHHKVVTPSSGTTEENLDAFEAEVLEKFEELTEGCMCASTSLVGTQTRVMPGFDGAGFIRSQFSTQVGTVTGECVGAQECALISKYTATISRRGRGRIYIPFIPESFVNSGQITTSAKTFYDTLAGAFLGTHIEFGTGGTANGCVYSRTANAAYDLTFCVLRPVTVTQQRRIRRKQPFAS